jgi:hypothetical protein
MLHITATDATVNAVMQCTISFGLSATCSERGTIRIP